MFKKLLCLAFSACLVLAFAPAALASSWVGYFTAVDGNGDRTTVYGIDEFEDGASYKLAVGGAVEVPDGYSLAFSDASIASYDADSQSIKGLAAGEVMVTYTEQVDSDDDWWDEPSEPETGTFTLDVISFESLQGKSHTVALAESSDWWSDYSATLQLAAGGIVSSDEDFVCLLSDSSHVYIESVGDGKITLTFSKAGKYEVELGIFGGSVKFSVKVVKVSLSDSALVLYKGKTATLKVKNGKKASFESANGLVATVSKSGKVKAKQLGTCTVTATVYGATLTCSVGVTTKKAYQAVANAKHDLKKKYKYSQAKRMQKNYRDCSSFVSRCYWDSALGRKIFAIGGESGKTWALPAAEQAQWLNNQGRSIGFKGITDESLLPGDTLYYQTGYAGTNDRFRHIDHAAIYVGGGLCLNTGGYGGKGTVGYRYYSSGVVRFIGRPIAAFTLSKASLSLKAGKSSKLRALCAKGKVTYKSSKSKVATVSSAGKVTAKSAGTCTVTAKCKAGTYRCRVVVE